MLKKLMSFLLTLIISINASVLMFSYSVFAEEPAALKEPKQMEYLTRGAIGAEIDGNVYLSWRLLGTEPMDTTFNIYCNGEKIDSVDITNYTHTGGNKNNKYQIAAVINGSEGSKSDYVTILQGTKDSDLSKGNFEPVPYAYFDIPVDPPADGDGCTYKNNNSANSVFSEPRFALGGANDASVGDVDGDGQYEIILKWYPSNAHDNSEDGKTGNTYIDAYEMDGTKLWRIDLGKNIRSGSHYTQFIVYDFDCDGKAEVAMKTAPGSIDGTGKYVTEAGVTDEIKNADNSKSYVNSRGRILTGPEYLTIFNGKTGEAMQTINYKPDRGNIDAWGKKGDKGNRVDRFLAGVAYLDGVHPSLIMCRGYYARSVVVAYDWDGKNLKERWTLDSGTDSKNAFYGQGNHSLSVADLDNDGFDEIVYGSAAIDHDGTVLHSTKWGHGDALHVSDFNGDGKQEIFSVLEEKPNYGTAYRSGKDGTVTSSTTEEFWHSKAGADTGRGIMVNASSKYNPLGFSSEEGNFFDKYGNKLNLKRVGAANFAIYWDGDLYRELADGLTISKVKDDYGMVKLWDAGVNNPVEVNNSTKNNICLQADLFGDWREEMVLRHADNSALRVFISLAPTQHKLTTFMHDSQYRCAVAWQNVGYNQPPHPSYYINPGVTFVQPNITQTLPISVSFNVKDSSGNPVENASIIIDKTINASTDAEGKATITVSSGSHSYKVKCFGYASQEKTFDIEKEPISFDISLVEKTDADISVSFKTKNGTKLKDNVKIGNYKLGENFVLEDSYKETITKDGKDYQYNPNLSDDNSFRIEDDTIINLVFEEQDILNEYDSEIYNTNFSINGYSSDSEKHKYTYSGTDSPVYGVSNNNIKYGQYSIGDNNITIDLNDSYTNFTAEFDMTYNGSVDALKQSVFGIIPYNGNSEGTAVGITLAENAGSLIPQLGSYSGGGSGLKSNGNIEEGKTIHYILNCDGNEMSLVAGDPATGKKLFDIQNIGLRNSVGSASKPVNKLKLGRSAGLGGGNINLGLSDLKIYQINAPTNTAFPISNNTEFAIPYEVNVAPTVFQHKTALGSYLLDIPKNITYEVTDSYGNNAASKGVSIDSSGTLKIAENAVSDNYIIKYKYNDYSEQFTVSVIKKKDLPEVYNSIKDTSEDGIFTYNGTDKKDIYKFDTAKISGTDESRGTYQLNQGDGKNLPGKEILGTLSEAVKGKASLDFIFRNGGRNDANGESKWAGREYEYELQFLDNLYDPENTDETPEDHVLLSLNQKFYADGAEELQYYTQSDNERHNVKSDDSLIDKSEEAVHPGITKRSVINWNIKVDFDFDAGKMNFGVYKTNGKINGTGENVLTVDLNNGYTYKNIPFEGGFKYIRIVTRNIENENGELGQYIESQIQLDDLIYKKDLFVPSKVDEDTVKVLSDGKNLNIDFEEPYNGGDTITQYKVSLLNPEDGTVVSEQTSDKIPVFFENTENKSYDIKIIAVNSVGEGQSVVASYRPDVLISVKDLINTEDGKVSFKSVIKSESEFQSAIVIASLYDSNGTLVDSKTVDTSFEANTPNSIDFELDKKSLQNLTLKVLIWDSLDNMKPIFKLGAYSQDLPNS